MTLAEPPRRLKLLAQDADDLAVISAALQDAVLKIGDIAYEPKSRLLTLAFNRFRWEGEGRKGGERVRTGLQFATVQTLAARRLRRDDPQAVVSLLDIAFTPRGGDDPGGEILLRFSGDADLKLEVECVEAALADVSDPWSTPRRPGHGD